MQLTFKNNQEINTLGKFWGTSIQYYYEMCKNWHFMFVNECIANVLFT